MSNKRELPSNTPLNASRDASSKAFCEETSAASRLEVVSWCIKRLADLMLYLIGGVTALVPVLVASIASSEFVAKPVLMNITGHLFWELVYVFLGSSVVLVVLIEALNLQQHARDNTNGDILAAAHWIYTNTSMSGFKKRLAAIFCITNLVFATSLAGVIGLSLAKTFALGS